MYVPTLVTYVGPEIEAVGGVGRSGMLKSNLKTSRIKLIIDGCVT